LANVGNLIYAVYVLSLPFGPVWALHGFHLGATGLMLFWYLCHSGAANGIVCHPSKSGVRLGWTGGAP
jgi:hypothetical protein